MWPGKSPEPKGLQPCSLVCVEIPCLVCHSQVGMSPSKTWLTCCPLTPSCTVWGRILEAFFLLVFLRLSFSLLENPGTVLWKSISSLHPHKWSQPTLILIWLYHPLYRLRQKQAQSGQIALCILTPKKIYFLSLPTSLVQLPLMLQECILGKQWLLWIAFFFKKN